MTVRVRFAPSPTGLPHVGNVRTALFNWLLARHHGGKFILRIEDTDVNRKVEGAVEAIMDGLRWLGLDWDEGPEVGGPLGPYFQSQRLDLYQSLAAKLIAQGSAYWCYCSSERLEAMRAEQTRNHQPPRYDRRCRDLSPSEGPSNGSGAVVRFKTPLSGQTSFHDLIRGDISFDNADLDDFVLLKSDGYPTYHLANVIDDHFMEITHIMRADEWLSSTPRHCLLYEALGFDRPIFAHLPMILGPDRSKLSKRHGATSLLDYREKGYLPQAMMNFLALLGWSLDDKTELLTKEELVRHFSLERIGKTGAIFNIEKLNWMNGVYIRQLPPDQLAGQCLPFLEKALPAEVGRPISLEYLKRIIPLVQERLKFLAEVVELTDFFFLERLDYPPSLGKGMTPEMVRASLETVNARLVGLPQFDTASLEALLRPLAAELGLKTGDFFGLIRVAVTGRTAAPPLFQTMDVLGRERCLKRIEDALGAVRSRP